MGLFNLTTPKEREGSTCKIRIGLPGGCKSLDQTLEDALFHLINEEEVYCTYWLNWNKNNFHYFSPEDEEGIKNVINNVRNAVVIFDELAQVWDPRSWENEAADVRRFFQLHRHRHVDIYANTQDVSLVAKTVGIVANEWIKCERIEEGLIMKIIRNLIGGEKKIIMNKYYMTYQEVKKEANGWDLGEIIENNGNKERKSYKISEIIRRDLNEYKVELVHRYCNKCKSRQGEQILKEETETICDWNTKTKEWELKRDEYCPKHKEERLIIKESGLYDTDYEPPIKIRPTITKEYRKCDSCGTLKAC